MCFQNNETRFSNRASGTAKLTSKHDTPPKELNMQMTSLFKLALLSVGLIGLMPLRAHAQEVKLEESNHAHQKALWGAIVMANTHVPTHFLEGDGVLIIPTWGLDLVYRYHPKWSVGLQADIKLKRFEVEDEAVILERKFPFSLSAVLHYHVLERWSVFSGPGYEFESGRNLFLFRLGTEYVFEISEVFEIGLNLIFDTKEGIYDSWTFGIAFNKRLK